MKINNGSSEKIESFCDTAVETFYEQHKKIFHEVGF